MRSKLLTLIPAGVLIAAGLGVAAATGQAQSQAQDPNQAPAQCNQREALVQQLDAQFGERSAAVGQVDTQSVVEIFVSKQGTWTILVSGTDGGACVLAAGEGWDSTEAITAALHGA
ncbi:MAG: hypothetical protein AB7S80_08260 [Rhizobiaceae bacterium]